MLKHLESHPLFEISFANKYLLIDSFLFIVFPQEADIEHRTQALKREGFWFMKRLTRLTEPARPKVHWDYLCEEMQWLSGDFAQERRWKRGVARKVRQTTYSRFGFF